MGPGEGRVLCGLWFLVQRAALLLLVAKLQNYWPYRGVADGHVLGKPNYATKGGWAPSLYGSVIGPLMIDNEEAFLRAKLFLDRLSREEWNGLAVRTIPELSFSDSGRLVVFYNAIEFLDGGDRGKMLGGNMPIVVDLETGACDFLTMDELTSFLERGLVE